MTVAHTKSSRVYLNETHQSAQISGWTVSHTREVASVTSLVDEGMRYIPGLFSGQVNIRGMFDSAAGALHGEIAAAIGVDDAALVTVAPDGTTIGQPALIAVTDVENYAVDASTGEAVTIAIDATPGDGVDLGVILHGHSAETTDGNGSSVDNAASSANGGVGTLHVAAYTGLTNIVIKVQHSADNSAWADLITYATATGATSERKTVSGTVNRYIRATWDVTGSGSATFVVAFARR